jgi:hypothetical protein
MVIDHQGEVAVLPDDLSRDGYLAPWHRWSLGAFQQRLQQFGNGRDFVGFLGGLDLPAQVTPRSTSNGAIEEKMITSRGE